jgi:tetratricopeptide (TPR) repeat protein
MPDTTRTHTPGDPDATRTGTPALDSDATPFKPQGPSVSLAPETSRPVVPGFEIEGEIGRGGMGVVYRAKQVGLNRTVALKALIASPFADPSLRARFLLEAESVAALEHPHIVKVHAFGEHGAHPYLAMEFLPGGTLAERIKERGPLPATEATELVTKLAAAVAHAHSRGIVHRDIKPLNVLIAADDAPRLTDFGLAKVWRADHNLSVTGQILGTPAYMSPEQAAGKVREVGTAADVYALGAVLYDVLTGRPPFVGDSVAVTLQKVLTEEPDRPRKHNPTIPRDLETICLKCLEKGPAKRYLTAQALADDLLSYSRGEPISARPAGALERAVRWVRQNRAVSAAAATVFLALVVVAVTTRESAKQTAAERDRAVKAEQETMAEQARVAEEQKKTAEALEFVRKQLMKRANETGTGGVPEWRIERELRKKLENAARTDRALIELLEGLEQKLPAVAGSEQVRKVLLSEATDCLEGLVAEGADRTLVVSSLYRLIGEMNLRLGDTAKAHEHFKRAVVEARRVLHTADPTDRAGMTGVHHGLARSLGKLAGTHAQQGNSDEALEAADEAIRIFSALAEDRGDTEAQAELVKARESRAKRPVPVAPPPHLAKP